MSEKPTSPPYAPFSGLDVRCPKCTGSVGVTFQPGGIYVEGGGAAFSGDDSEWLLRECEVCGYNWPERIANAD